SSQSVAPNDAAEFVRFCVAFRIHCYFELSLLPDTPSNGKPAVVFVLGGPGAGKGTQCARISETFGYLHLSAGDLLREERSRPGSEYGELIQNYIKEGQLVPVEITVKLIKQAMEKHGWAQGKFLIDGFPRSFDNMDGWSRVMGDAVDVQFALFFDCSEAVMEARILERGKTSGRADDNAEAIRKRLRTFKEESMPVVEHLKSKGLLRQVQCEKAVEEVWKDVRALFGPSVVFVLGGPGAGKGTLCSQIVQACGYQHLSAGDLLREERKRPGSQMGELIENHIKEGKLVPANITVELILQAMREKGWGGGKYLIDGFPRSFDNLAAWEAMAGDQVLVKFVLYLDVCEQVMEARLLERGKTSGRADDNIESIRKRFLTFHQESRPVVDKFQAEGRVIRMDAEKHRDDVWRDVQALFGPSVVFVLGGPGSGKGTQCAKIAESFGYVHLSAGDLLREERAREGSEYGDLINSYIKEGKLVPVEITIKLIQQAMVKFGWEGGRYLIDGFPRSFDNLAGWESVIGNSVRVKFVLFFDASEDTMQARIIERGKTSGRSDDNLESIKKRFATFQQESMPVVERYRLQGLVRRIDAEQAPEKVWKDVQRNFGPQVIFVLGGPGAGKGTQCARIAANFGFQHLSAGDLLREERKRPGSELGELIESHIKEGKLVPVSVVVRLLQKAMEQRGWEDGKYLIDGFPRSTENMQGWNELIGPKVDVKFCLFFDCSEAVMEARLLERGKTSGRSDDNIESIKKRFATYKQESLPVVEKFSSEGAMRRINAEQSLDEVWNCVQEVMRNEQDGHLLNQAIVLIKPSSFNKDTQRFVQSFFATHKASP
ncbi:CMPK, partial [Symbiodinium pilosum]